MRIFWHDEDTGWTEHPDEYSIESALEELRNDIQYKITRDTTSGFVRVVRGIMADGKPFSIVGLSGTKLRNKKPRRRRLPPDMWTGSRRGG